MKDSKPESNRCPVCGRVIPAKANDCPYCARDLDNPPKIISFSRTEEPEKKKWGWWALGGALVFLAVWLINSFLHFVDYLLKSRW